MQARMKVLLAGYWYKKIWKSLGPLHEIDTNGDGIISKDDVKEEDKEGNAPKIDPGSKDESRCEPYTDPE